MLDEALKRASLRLPVKIKPVETTTNTISSLDKYLKNYGFGSAMPINTYTNTIEDEIETARKNRLAAQQKIVESDNTFQSITQPKTNILQSWRDRIQPFIDTASKSIVTPSKTYIGRGLESAVRTAANALNPLTIIDTAYAMVSAPVNAVWNMIAEKTGQPKWENKTFTKSLTDIYRGFGGKPIDTSTIQNPDVKAAAEDINKGINVWQGLTDRTVAYADTKQAEVADKVKEPIKIISNVINSVPQMATMFLPNGMLAYAASSVNTNISSALKDGTISNKDLEYALYSSEVDIASEMIFGLTESANVLIRGALGRTVGEAAKKAVVPTVGMLIMGTVKQAGEEGAEELIAFPFQSFLDWKYNNKDKSFKDYWNEHDSWQRWGEAGMVGALAGGLMTAPQAISDYNLTRLEKAKLESQINTIMNTPVDKITIEQLSEVADLLAKGAIAVQPVQTEVNAPIQATTAPQTVEHPLPVKSKITTPPVAKTVVAPVVKAKTANKVNTMTETNPVKSKVVTSKPLSIAETFEIHSADTKAKTGEYEIIKAGFGGQSKVKINEKVTGKIVGNIGVKSGVLTHIPTGLKIYGGSPYDVKLNAQQSIQVAKYYDTFVSQYSDTPSIIKAFNQQINGKTIRQIFENRIKEYVDNFDNNIKSKKITPVIAEKPQKRVEKASKTILSETEKNIISKLPIGTVVTTNNAETGETQKLSVEEFVKLKGTTISDVKFRRILNGESGAVNNLSYTITEPVKKMTAEAKLSEPTKKLLDTMKKDFIAGKDISSKISEYVKTEEGKTILNDIHDPIDVINKIAELNKAFKVSDKSDVDKLFKFNLQLFAYKKALDDMDGEDTFDERRYLKHILDRVESTSPEDIVKKLTDMFTDSELLYKVYINEKAVETGRERISQSKTPDTDAETLINQLYNEEKIATPDDIVVVNEYLHRLIEKEDLRDFHRVSSMISILGTKGGQFIQAFRLLGESLPYMQADRQMKELARVIDTPKVDLNKVDTKATETEKKVREVEKSGIGETIKEVNKNVEEKTKEIKKEKLSLAERLKNEIDRISNEKEKPKKVQSAETKLLNRLVRKAREVIPSTSEIDRDNPYEVLAEIVMNRAQYSKVWDDAMKLVESDTDLSERDSLVEYLNTPTDPITANKYRSLTVMQAIKDMDIPISQLAKDYFLKGNEALSGFIEVLKSNLPDMDEASYKYLEQYVTETYKDKMESVRKRAIEIVRKSTMKKDIKKETRNEQEIMIDMLSNAVYYDVFNIETAKDAWAKKLNVPRITQSMSDNITNAMFAIARAKTQEAKDAIYEDMTTKVAAEMATTKSEKISAWLVTSMLLNPVTLNRNMLSNIGNMMPATLTDILANKLMRIQNVPENMRLYGNERLTMKSNDPIISVVKKLVTPDLIRRTLAQSDKLTFGTEIQKKKTIFKTRGLENLRKAALQELTTGQLTTEGKLAKLQIKAWGDAYAYQWHFMPAMANRMNVLGYNSATTESEKQTIIDKSIEYATEIATENTYRNRVWIANVLHGISKNALDTKKIRELEKKGDALSLEKAKQERAKGRARQVIIKTIYPFVVTPAAIVTTAYKYSPLAGVSAIAQMVSQKYIKGEYTEAQKVINSRKLSQAIIGTGTQYLVGFVMASLGMLTGAPPQDKKEKEEWALLGKRAYSIYIPGMGSFSIDWLQPLASGLVMGAQIYQNATSKDTLIQKLQGIGYASLDSLLRNTVFDNQTLQLGYNDKGIPDIAWKIATGGIIQGLPSVVKRFNKVVDPYVRNVYQGSALKIFTNQFLSGVPFGSFLVDPQIDIWGNKQRQVESKYARGVIERTFLNMVSPFLVSTPKQDDTTKEVLRVFKETQLTDGNIALPSVPTSKITAKVYGVKKEWDLVGNDYIWLLQRTGELSKQYIDAVINSSGYTSMSNSAKAKLFADKYAKAREVARKEYIKNHPK